MVNVVGAVRSFAEGLAYPQPRAFVVARTLREDNDSLLPRDLVGRNNRTELVPPHLTNLLFGMAAADPIANAPALVRDYRAARYQTPLDEILGKSKPSTPILGTGLLGPALDNLIDVLGRQSEKARAVRQAFAESFQVTLIVGEALEAVVEDTATCRKVHYDAKAHHTSHGGQTFRLHGKEWQIEPLRRVATLKFAHFELAAELWADSLKRGAVYKASLLEPSNDGPETETAASGPCRDQNATAVSDQTAKTELDGRSPSHLACEREKYQPSPVERSGRHSYLSGTIHDRTNPCSALSSFA